MIKRMICLLIIATFNLSANAGPSTKPTPTTKTPQDPFSDRNRSESTDSITAASGGIWYNPHHNGEGFFIQVDDRFPSQMTVTWYTYDVQGQQMWLIGTAEYRNGDNQVVIDMLRPQGTRFGAQFNGSEITQPSWGTMTLTFNSCAEGVAVFESNEPSIYGSGTIPITKIADNANARCLIQSTAVEPPFYSQKNNDPAQGFGVGDVTTIGDHQVNGIHITSERLLIKNNRCHFEVTLKNKTGSNNASVGLSYQFFSGGQEVARIGTGAAFTAKEQTITKTIEIFLSNNSSTGNESCNRYDRIEIIDFQAASL